MPSSDLLIPFFLASFIFACVPGAGMFFATAQTVAYGRRAGCLSAVGFHTGGYVHILAAAFGLAILLEAVPVLYAGVKLAGAAYLVWLGLRLLRSSKHGVVPVASHGSAKPGLAFRDGVVVEVLNPKTALFFVAFLPQFTDVSASLPIWGQILVLGTIVNVMFSVTDVACVLLSEKVTRLLGASQAAGRLGRRIGGGILVGLGINLAASRDAPF